MQVRVLFFGRLKDIVGKSEESAELSEGARVEDLFARYGRSFPELAQFRSSRNSPNGAPRFPLGTRSRFSHL
jgi:molybdopterin converting factor small subunit